MRILDAEVLAVNSASQPAVQFSEAEAKITFDYLEEGEGVVLQVVHDGADEGALRVYGHIMGATKLRRVSSFDANFMEESDERPFYQKLFASRNPYIFLNLITAASALITSLILVVDEPESYENSTEIFLVVLLLTSIIGLLLWSAGPGRMVGPKQPRGFRSIDGGN